MMSLQAAANAIAHADALLITAGAGMGVDSGLPDFRGTEGFWNAYPPYRDLRLSFSQLANPSWFIEDPALAWGFYGHRLNLYRTTTPHAGFAILRKWAQRMSAGTRIFTSNVDGQFQIAGFSDDHVTEVHGSIHHLQCTSACSAFWPAVNVAVAVDPVTFRAIGQLPHCHCGQLARPAILMFGDDGWNFSRTARQEAALDGWLKTLLGKRLVVVECGAGSAIPTVRQTSEYYAHSLHATLIRINIREPQTPSGQIGLALGAREALQKIDAMIA